MEPTNAVVFRDVSVRRSGLAILEHVNATVPQGSCTVIVGPNGAGKTTLILALIGEMRHDGDIDVMTGRSGNPLRLGYVPQRISIDRGMPLTVVEFLVMGIQKRPLWLGIRPSPHSLEGKWSRRNTSLPGSGDLSGGEMQRVLLALALQQEPELLVLDDGFSGESICSAYCWTNCAPPRDSYGQPISAWSSTPARHLPQAAVFAEGTPDESADAKNLMALFGMHMPSIPMPHRGPAKGPPDLEPLYRLVSLLPSSACRPGSCSRHSSP